MNKYIETEAEALEVLRQYGTRHPRFVSVDTETSGLAWESDETFLIQVGWSPYDNYAFTKNVFHCVKPILEDSVSEKVLANIKFDGHFLEQSGMNLEGKWHDVQVMARLLFPKAIKGKRVSLALKDLATNLIDEAANKYEIELKDWMKKEKNRRKKQLTKALRELGYTRKQFDEWEKACVPFPEDITELLRTFKRVPTYKDAPKEIMEPYATGDTKYTLALFHKFLPQLKSLGLMEAYERDMQTVKHVYGWEKTGWNMDMNGLELAVDYGERKIAHLQTDLAKIASINPNSGPQVIEYFTNKGMPIPNAQADTLKQLDDPVAKKILEIKGYEKVLGTYLKPIYEKAKRANGRLHGGFNVAGPVTGRFSSSNPNLQNLPREFRDEKVNPRNFFIPTPGYKLFFCDYGQMEVVIMAEYSKDENLVHAILNGEDIHTKTALQIDPDAPKYYQEGVPKDEQPPEFQKIRKAAKQTTFGIFYGIGAAKLGKQIGVSQEQARIYKKNFFRTYPGVYQFMQNVQHTAQSRPGRWVRNKFGRIYWGEEDREYALVDYLIQGTGADMAKIAIDRCEKILKPMKSRIISMIHDELIFEVHETEQYIIPELHKAMTHWPDFEMPIEVDIEYSDTNWAEKKPWKAESLEQAI